MKKTALCAILLVSLFGFASAQTGAGAMWIGGTAGFASAGGDLYGADERSTSISLDPVLDYFVAPNIFLGPVLSFDRYSHGDHSSTEFGIGATIGYTLGSGRGGSMIPFLKGQFAFTSSNTKNSTEDKSSGTNIILGGGLLFPVAKHAGITVEVGYELDSVKPEGADESVSGNIIGVTVGVLGLLF